MPSSHRQSQKVKMYERMKKKEYTKSYLELKEKREEKPNNYPKTRLILIKDFFRSKDLYKAISFFLGAQVAIMTIAAGVRYPNLAGAMNLLAIITGVIAVFFAIREINTRQRWDETRRRLRWQTVLGVLIMMLLAVFASTFLFNILGVTMPKQPNQMSLDELVGQFPVAMVFTMVVVSPFVEEIVFRELLPYATGPSYLSFIISSLIFVALHAPFGIMGWTSYGILAGGFLLARLKDNNVYTGIVVHMVWNTMSILL